MPNAVSSDPRDVLRNKFVDMLRRATVVFVDDADRLSDRQIRVFDEVPEQLISKMETKAPVEIGARPRHRG
jgi:hypothetical protein